MQMPEMLLTPSRSLLLLVPMLLKPPLRLRLLLKHLHPLRLLLRLRPARAAAQTSGCEILALALFGVPIFFIYRFSSARVSA
jgi:hypothetical protein